MMSYTTSAAWSRPVFSPCYTKLGQHCGVVLSGRITTVAMFRSGQLGMCCSVETNCSGLSARLIGASVTCDRALDTCGSSCVSGAARPFFIPMVHSPLGPQGTCQHRSSPLEEARLGPRGSAGAVLSGRQSPEPWDTWQRRSPSRQGGKVRS
jgi:hypothetical protein